jgi:hypothetical protein
MRKARTTAIRHEVPHPMRKGAGRFGIAKPDDGVCPAHPPQPNSLGLEPRLTGAWDYEKISCARARVKGRRSTCRRLLAPNWRCTVKRPDLSRYDDDALDRMLYSYRSLAHSHLESGHYALAKWATRMVTWLTVELNTRESERRFHLDSQMTLADAPQHDVDGAA